MTVLRQQPAATSRASSRSPGATSSRMTRRSDSATPDVRHRKISYKEWSDDGSDVYYIDDGFLDDSITSQKKEKNPGNEPNKYNLSEERQTFNSYSPQPQEYPIQDRNTEESQNTRSNNHLDDNENGSDVEKTNEDKIEKPEISSQSPLSSSAQSENSSSETQQRKLQPKKQNLNILEEIIRTRNQVSQRNIHAKKASNTPAISEGRKLESRGRINNRIIRSPYSEPAPYLGGRPMRFQRQGSSCKKKQPRTPSPVVKTSDNTDHQKYQDFGSFSAIRPPTQAGISRPRRDPLTSPYRSDSRGTAVYLRPTRSKSAPGYKMHDDRRGIPKKREILPNKNAKSAPDSKAPSRQSNNSNSGYMRSDNELESSTDYNNHNDNNNSGVESGRQSRKMRHQSSKSARATTTIRETSWGLAPSSSQPRSQSVMASRPIEVSKRHSPRNPDDLRYTSCCMPAVENDLLVRFGVEPKGQRPFYVSNSNRRYASAAEMDAASRRLMAPTAAKLIRDRMRWAPNNDDDLEDPVRVIRETVARKSRKRESKYHNGIAWESFDMDSDGQMENEERVKNKVHRGYRLTDKESVRKGVKSNSEEVRGGRNDKGDRDDGNHHDNERVYTNYVEKETPATIDFKDRDGVAATTKQRDPEGECRSTTRDSRATERFRSRSISPSAKSGSSLGSRSRSTSRSSISKSRSRSRSRSRSASRSTSRSRSRSTSPHRSRSWAKSSRSPSGERSSSPFASGGHTQTEQESGEDVKPKVGFETSAETFTSGEERGGEPWTLEGQGGHDASGKRDQTTTPQQSSNHRLTQGVVPPDDSNVIGEISSPDSSSDDHRARSSSQSSPQDRPGSRKPLASGSSTSSQVQGDRSHWGEDSGRTTSGTRSNDSIAHEYQGRGDERAGDDFFGRGRDNGNRGLERGHAQTSVSDSDGRPMVPQNSLYSSESDGPRILYSVNKGYAQETEEGSSYYSTDYNADVTDVEDGVTRGVYHRVTFHDDS